jgi:hypothetical protein
MAYVVNVAKSRRKQRCVKRSLRGIGVLNEVKGSMADVNKPIERKNAEYEAEDDLQKKHSHSHSHRERKITKLIDVN